MRARRRAHSCLSVLRLFLALAAILVSAPPARCQTAPYAPLLDPRNVDATRIGQPINLNGNWLLHGDDDPQFADPSYDDSTWKVISSRTPVGQYLPHADRLWYRTHVHIDPGAHDLALLLRGTSGSMQVYVNGVQLRSLGSFAPGGESVYNEMGQLIRIPDGLLASHNLVICVRASVGKLLVTHTLAGFTPAARLTLGPADVVGDEEALYGFRDLTSNCINLALAIVLFLVVLALASVLRSNREYAALVLHIAAIITASAVQIYSDIHPHGTTLGTALFFAFQSTVSVIAAFEFYRIVLGIRRTRAMAVWEWAFAVQAFLYAGFSSSLLYRGRIVSYTHGETVGALVEAFFLIPLDIGIPVAAFWIWRKRRNLDAALLLLPTLISSFLDYSSHLLFPLFIFGLSRNSSLGNAPIPYFMVGWQEVGSFAYTLALLLFIVVRALRIARSRATLAAEVHAAQSVQQLLLTPTDNTPGFLVDIAYRPAAELGGDFFLISPVPGLNGAAPSLLAIVGDVSGKGLPAAMRVSMILGVLRREPSHNPAAILASLNDALLTQTDLGFTTACCVHLESSGCFTLANAGHIPPYIGSTELPSFPALPLGLAPAQIYERTSGQLLPGEHLVLLSDGIPEARNRKGELFGFNRLSAIAAGTAAGIAKAAETFGQEDDITVLTLACTA